MIIDNFSLQTSYIRHLPAIASPPFLFVNSICLKYTLGDKLVTLHGVGTAVHDSTVWRKVFCNLLIVIVRHIYLVLIPISDMCPVVQCLQQMLAMFPPVHILQLDIFKGGVIHLATELTLIRVRTLPLVSIEVDSVDREVLNTVRTYLANYIQSLNFIELGYISNYPKERVNDSLLKIKMISSNVIQFYELLEITLEEYNDDKAKEFKESLIRFHNEYLGLIADFGWILDFYVNKKIEADSKIEVQKYKEFIKSTGNYYNEEKRIWKLLEDGNYNIYRDAPILMNKLLNRLEFSSVIKDIKVFIKYEQTKIEESVTKQ